VPQLVLYPITRIAVLGNAAAIASWPAAIGLVVVAACVVAISSRRPAAGYIIAVGATGFEGTVKVLLTGESTPFSVSPEAFGAALLDVILFTAWAVVLITDRGRTPTRLWKKMDRSERLIVLALCLWMAMSAIEILVASPTKGLKGFRLTQAYAPTALASLIVFRPGPNLDRRVRGLLIALAAVSGYAALRVIIGPSAAEESFALSKHTVSSYGGAFRAVGSFSSAVGLESYLTPAAVFALLLALFWPRHRTLSAFVTLSASVGIIASYGRASLVGVVLGTLAGLTLALTHAGSLSRPKAATAVALVFLFGLGAAGTIVANQATPQLQARLNGLAQPWQDKSLSLRSENWNTLLKGSWDSPFGKGIGTVGSASASTRAKYVTADNTYLKVLVEQGFVGLMVFVVGLFGVWLLTARRLIGPHFDSESRLIGCAALAACGSFLAIAVTGEYMEQPGKVLAWALLGMALAQGFFMNDAAEQTRTEPTDTQHELAQLA
jgi:hypothetical protein